MGENTELVGMWAWLQLFSPVIASFFLVVFYERLKFCRKRQNEAKAFRTLFQAQLFQSIDEAIETAGNQEPLKIRQRPTANNSYASVEHMHEHHKFWDNQKHSLRKVFGADFYLEVLELFIRFRDFKGIYSQSDLLKLRFIRKKMEELNKYLKAYEETCIYSQAILNCPWKNQFLFTHEYHQKNFSDNFDDTED